MDARTGVRDVANALEFSDEFNKAVLESGEKIDADEWSMCVAEAAR